MLEGLLRRIVNIIGRGQGTFAKDTKGKMHKRPFQEFCLTGGPPVPLFPERAYFSGLLP